MHEFSVMTQIVDSVFEEAKKRNAQKVEQVDLEVGEFTMLGQEQLRFAYEVLSKDSILQGSTLEIRTIKGKIKCDSCGCDGNITDRGRHFSQVCAHTVMPKMPLRREDRRGQGMRCEKHPDGGARCLG